MSEKTLRPACSLCVTWICSTCGNRRNRMNAMWVNPYCARCKGTEGTRLALRHRSQYTYDCHVEEAAKKRVMERAGEDGRVFRWPAPSVDEVPVPGVLPDSDPVTEPRHPDGTNADAVLMGRSFATWAKLLSTMVDRHQGEGTATWSEIMLSQVFAALSETEAQRIFNALNDVSDSAAIWRSELERRL